jgi:FkbM family methyltransferase
VTNTQQTTLLEAVGRIWALIAAGSSEIGDLFERISESFYAKVVRSGDTVVDGGAHTGRHTIPLARLVGAEGLVVAFEPLPSAAQKLSQLLDGSGLNERVQLRGQALGSERGRRDFFVVNNMPEFSGLRSRQYVGFVPDQTQIQVDVDTIDSALSMRGVRRSVSFLKLDLEGGEFRALQGAERTLRSHGPCCVFENGLASSADGYSADEFFGYFAHIGYELYDILGCRVSEACWVQPGPWQFVAMPRAHSGDLILLLWTSVLEELLTSARWPSELSPPQAFFPSQATVPTGRVLGCLDRVETSINVSGWAGDPATGRPTSSLTITLDGNPIATAYPGKTRHDVVAATGQIGFERSGFEVALRTTARSRVEVFAEASDGTFVRLSRPV